MDKIHQNQSKQDIINTQNQSEQQPINDLSRFGHSVTLCKKKTILKITYYLFLF